jgi:hypothetical protein
MAYVAFPVKDHTVSKIRLSKFTPGWRINDPSNDT